MLRGKLLLTAFLLSSFGGADRLQAANIIQNYSGALPATITGTLSSQGSALEETFTLSTAGGLTIFTSSYAGGGFEPNITLYNAAGNYVASQSPSGTSPLATASPATGQALDGYLQLSGLAAGSYIVTVTDWQLSQALTATNLSAGFGFNLGDGTNFIDQTGATRTGNFALTIQPAASAVPEPGFSGIAVLSIGAARLMRRKKHNPKT